ncbi:MAG TPA: hypothetical protein VIS96_00065 [Terrimicrobiaceae bacterium]
MKPRRILWIVLAAGIFLAVLAAVGTTVWIGRFLRSEAFRKLIAAKTGEAFGSQVDYGPLRWTGSSVFVDSIQATGLPGSAVESLHADQVRADINWRAAFDGAWKVDHIEVVSVDGTFRPGSSKPRAFGTPPSAPARGIASWLPTRFEVGQVSIAKAQVRFRSIDNLEIASLENSALRVHPDGAGWAIEGAGGVLALAKLPVLTVVNFRSRAQGDVFFLTDSQFRLGDSGRISASGEFANNSKLRVEWSQVDVVPFLSPAWRSRITGIWAGKASIEWPESGLASGRATGSFRLTDGFAQNMELLDRVASFTGAPQFRRMPLQEISGNYEWLKGTVQITNLVAESKGLLRVEGNCTITNGGMIAGALRVGVTPQTLQWLPGSRERVFTAAQSGYVWTDVKISGSLQDLREDLSMRLATAMRDETIDRGARVIEDIPSAAKDGAQGVFDALVPLIK